jgi:hypothetical protein
MSTTVSGDTGVSQIQAGASGNGLPVFQCRAWVNFDGTKDSTGAASTANTARFIRASGNVSSVVQTASGNYTINFVLPMADTLYTLIGSASAAGATARPNTLFIPQDAADAVTTGSVKIRISQAFDNLVGSACQFANVAIFR